MNTPISDFLNKYADEDFARFHMPGHKGRGGLSEAYDITEINGADSLFEASGIILESEENCRRLFNSGKTLYSTQGSTLCIQTMLTLACQNTSDERPLVIAVRNAHKAFINACILLDVEVRWVYPKYHQGSIASGEYSASDIEKAILSSSKKPSAVFITSPDYLGRIADVKGISDICEKHGVKLLVDNAHGAYLHFLNESIHPLSLGADMCCDSAHKTLPVLTGGGYLHISQKTDKNYYENAKNAMSLFSSTSPSYLILASLDLCNKYIFERLSKDLNRLVPKIELLKKELSERGFEVFESEPLKLTLYTINNGVYGLELAKMLRQDRIECEYADETHIVFMFSPFNTDEEIEMLRSALFRVKFKRARLVAPMLECESLTQRLSIREAGLSISETIPVSEAEGRICAKVVVACPPGIPICVSGEEITKKTVKILKRYSILSINVVK